MVTDSSCDLRVLAAALRKVLAPELVALVEAEVRRGLARQVREPVCGNWTPAKMKEADANPTKDEPRRCPRCGSYVWVYKGGIQVCADCGR